ncbi:MAG: hypothetical protein JWO36_3903 [Myxococcales bacterium]|nr:hypothetical protein [Myxococcales bacterium]
MTKPTPPRPPEELTKPQARRILSQMGENGKPPELGISHVNVGNESYLKTIDATYIQDLVRSGEGSSFKLIQGTYGAGKTHFLYCVRDLAWRRELLTAFVTISPKEFPFNRPLAIYRAVAQRLELPRGADGEETRGIDDVIRRRVEDRVAVDGKEETRKWIDTALGRAPISRHSFRDAAVGVARAVLDGDEPTARRLGAWLRGEDISLTEVKANNIYELPSNENGFGMFRSLAQLVHRLGYEGIALLLDEAERQVTAEAKPTKAMAETMDHLRELIDLCGKSELPRTLILYAVTPSFTEHVLPMYPALQQRLGAPVQFLSASNPKAPVIDLEALDLEPRKLLVEVGKRLLRVSKRAYDWTPDDKIVQSNLEQLAATVTEEQLEVGHRRQFVKLSIRMLDQLRLGTVRSLTDEDIQELVHDEQALLLEHVEDDEPVETFLGLPIPKKKKPPKK